MVVTSSLKVTRTVDAVAHEVDEVVVVVAVLMLVDVVLYPDCGVWEAGKDVDVAVVYDPYTERTEQVLGTEVPDDPAQDGGLTPERRAIAERKAA